MKLVLVLALMCGPAMAQDTPVCPAGPDRSAQMSALFDSLRVARDDAEARMLTDDLWRMWTTAPDARAQGLLDEGMRQRDGYDFLGARDTFDTLIEYCPGYAEGYNQRGFASFLRQDYAAALVDIDAALAITPTHLGALSGKVLTLIALDRADEAQAVLRQAVAINPWLKERALLVPVPGKDI